MHVTLISPTDLVENFLRFRLTDLKLLPAGNFTSTLEHTVHRTLRTTPLSQESDKPYQNEVLGLFLAMDMRGQSWDAHSLSSLRGQYLRADFREGDEDSNFSVFRVQQFSEWPKLSLLNCLIHWISPLFTEKPFFSLKSASSHPLSKNRLLPLGTKWLHTVFYVLGNYFR